MGRDDQDGLRTRRAVLTGALASTGVLAVAGRARAADPGLDAAVDGTCDDGWAAWVDVAVLATAKAWDAALAEAVFLDGRIDGPVLRGLQAEVPRGMVEDELGAALVDVGVPRVIARAWAKAAERAWAKQWRKWTLPPTKAFPSFAAVAAPEAPPTEAEPFPLRPDASRAYGELSPEELYVDLADRLGDLLNLPGLPEAVKAWATRVGGGVAAWSEQATLGGIWGQGPVPAFAPPYVPVGPVIAGDNVAAPGHGSAVGVVRPSLAEVVARAKG